MMGEERKCLTARATPIHERRHALWDESIRRFGADPTYQELLLIGAHALIGGDISHHNDAIDALLERVERVTPEFALLMGPIRLRMMLKALVAVQVGVAYFPEPPDSELLNMLAPAFATTEWMEPDMPATLPKSDGSEVRGYSELSKVQRLTLGSYIDSLRPAIKPGRKAKTPKAKRSGRKSIDRAKASQALAFHKSGKTDLEIADALNLWRDGETRYDNKAVGRVRQRARYMWLAGERY